MKTTITFRHMKASPAVKDFVREKIEKLDKYDQKALEAHVVLSTERARHEAEVVVISKGRRATGKASTTDMYASIEAAIAKVEKILQKNHDKRVKAKRAAERAAAVA